MNRVYTAAKNRQSEASPSEAIRQFQKKYASNARQEIQIIRSSPAMEPPSPQTKLPTPWLADSEWLLAELTKARETILRIPFRLDNASDIKSAIDRIWNLERTLRDLLHYHRDGQRDFVKAAEKNAAKAPGNAKGAKIVRLRA